MKKVSERKSHPEYWIWAAMLQRCFNARHSEFKNYGWRGIVVCDEWRSYDRFITDMGHRPSDRHSLDRIDNNGNYEPSNCRWADSKTQCRNTRRNVVLEVNGQRKLLCDWASHFGISPSLIRNRLDKMGWTVERAVTTPPDSSRYHPPSGLTAMARAAGLKIRTVRGRLERGWTIEEALRPL